jgi:hypothetical protein
MDHIFQRFRFDRRQVLIGAAALMAGDTAAEALSRPTPERVKYLIDFAMKQTKSTKLARGSIVGLADGTETRQLSRKVKNTNYWFAVAIPYREDGLLLFSGSDKPVHFSMHRTGTHMRRLISARNNNGKLLVWTGRDADQDFAKQLATWV